jgi:hypothetical protein
LAGSSSTTLQHHLICGKKAAAKPAKEVAAAPPAAAATDLVSVAALQKAKKLVQDLGGVQEAKQALAALGQLLD